MNSSLKKAAIVTTTISSISVLCWELYVRSLGFDTSFDDDPSIWADKRREVYKTEEEATVFIGSSRIKFDLDINTWESLTGNHAIQLACVGSNPIPMLKDLADDENFKGRLVVDVTEGLFFSPSTGSSSTPNKNLKFYKDETRAQRASFLVSTILESQLVFLDKDRLSLNATLVGLRIPNREGVFQFPIFPPDIGRCYFSRQEYMTDKFLTDTSQQNQTRKIWAFFGRMNRDKPPRGAKLDSILTVVKASVDKIKARGGQVFFVRTPSSGPLYEGEKRGFPRGIYWDELLKRTQCVGIHFADYAGIDKLQCPEFSHLSQPDAIFYTKNLIKILNEEKGWKFSKMTQP